MFELLSVNMNRIYPTFVVSTMSSGKSTLINALVGKELMPSRNTATTAKALAILDNDNIDNFVAHTVNVDGEYTCLDDVNKKTVVEYNDTNKVSEMIIEGQIKGIKNNKKSLLIIDTPGVNNSLDDSHSENTKRLFDSFDEGLILYVFNVQQLATYDDEQFFSWIVKKISEKPGFNIIFAINKVDSLDSEKEPLQAVMQNCKEYIEKRGINNPTIIPIAAKYALMFKKALNGETLGEFEEESFSLGFKRFSSNSRFSLSDSALLPGRGDVQRECRIDSEKYTASEIYSALYNTGLPALEGAIENILVKSSKVSSPKVRFKKKKEFAKSKKSKKGKRI